MKLKPEEHSLEAAVKLHQAAFLAIATRIAGMLGDLSHLNKESKEMKEEWRSLQDEVNAAFAAKAILENVRITLNKTPKASERSDV